MKKYYIGLDIGGTKCRASLGVYDGEKICVVERSKAYATQEYQPYEMLEVLLQDVRTYISDQKIESIGISCGGPLNSREGIILSPPNLIGWNEIRITSFFQEACGLPVYLCNDANACALCEWMFGVGKGYHNMMFLTFGTGMGAGMILDDRLYIGSSDMAGEVGHIRLEEEGPVGYGKKGSFEGYCSGGGIAQLAQMELLKAKQLGTSISWGKEEKTSAKDVAIAAHNDDQVAKHIIKTSAIKLGKAISIFIDVLNLDCIVLGSIYERNVDLFYDEMKHVINEETLSYTNDVCTIKPSYFADTIGDIAALCVARYYGEKQNERA